MKYKKQFVFKLGVFFSLIFITYIIVFYLKKSYLPPPFVFHKFDSFMDFYNVMHWSQRDGIYTEWRSVYPPLNFLIMRIFEYILNLNDFNGGSVELRRIVGFKIAFPIAAYLISVAVAVKISCKNTLYNNIKYIFMICILSAPFLFAIERGNLIILCVPLLSIYAYSDSKLVKAICLGLLVNLKPYFILIILIEYVSKNKNKNDVLLVSAFSVLILVVSGLILGQEYYLLPINIFGFAADGATLDPIDILALPITMLAFKYMPSVVYGSGAIRIVGYFSMILIYIYIIKSMIIIHKKFVKDGYLLILTIIVLTNFSVSTGGYGALYYIAILPILYKHKLNNLLMVIIIFIFSGIWDLIHLYNFQYEYMGVYFSGKNINVPQSFTLGTIVRPIANFVVLFLFYKEIKGVDDVRNIKNRY